ncbi:hypothetical protein BLOT_011701, partial [Blomia tropicalis]
YLYSNDTHVKVGTFRNRSFNSNFINSVFYFTNVGVFISIALELYRLYSKSYIVHRLTTTDVASYSEIQINFIRVYFSHLIQLENFIAFKEYLDNLKWQLLQVIVMFNAIPSSLIVVINFHIQIVHILARLPHNSAILEMMTCICNSVSTFLLYG